MRRRRRGRTVGLLGGSFNPAHAGHLEISRAALRILDLDAVWWLVSPQNPLKSRRGMAPLADRLAAARAVAARDRRIVVTDLERRLGTRYTADTIERLCGRYPHHRFVWLMGADNLKQFGHWQRWRHLARRVPIAVFNRPTYAFSALSGHAARALARYRLADRAARRLIGTAPPAWVFVWSTRHPASSTAIRAAGRPAEAETGQPRVEATEMATAKEQTHHRT